MKRSLQATVVLVVGAAILAVGLVGARLMQTGPQELAHAQGFVFAIDADPWGNGNNPCDVIDATNTVSVGADHQVAVCVVNPPEKSVGVPDDVSAFTFYLTYDPLLNQCKTNPACPEGSCLDDNPDANAGSTLGSGHVPTSPSLGTGWDCNIMDVAEPTCADGKATLNCLSMSGPFTSGGLDPFPLAIVSFHAIGGGTDTLHTADNELEANNWTGAVTGEADPPPESAPADVTKSGSTPLPTATQTATATATATATPCPDGICPTNTPTPKAWTKTPTPEPTGTPTPEGDGGDGGDGGEPPPPPPPPTSEQMPQVVPPGTGSGPDGISWASTAVWLLAAAGAVSVSLGGLCFRRARHR